MSAATTLRRYTSAHQSRRRRLVLDEIRRASAALAAGLCGRSSLTHAVLEAMACLRLAEAELLQASIEDAA